MGKVKLFLAGLALAVLGACGTSPVTNDNPPGGGASDPAGAVAAFVAAKPADKQAAFLRAVGASKISITASRDAALVLAQAGKLNKAQAMDVQERADKGISMLGAAQLAFQQGQSPVDPLASAADIARTLTIMLTAAGASK